MTDTSVLSDLYRRVRALGNRDPDSKIFGASMHQWTVFQLSPEEQAEAEALHGLTLPDDYRWWISEASGAGIGPFYGLLHPLDSQPCADELAGAIPLSDHGCGYFDFLLTRGEHAGRVWVDFREGGGPLTEWYPSFAAWLDAWLLRSFAEWGIEYLGTWKVTEADEPFLVEVAAALARIDAGTDDPMLAQYQLPHDKLRIARGRLALHGGRASEAEAMFDAAAEVSKEPDAMRALGRCEIARARGDHAAWLAAADAGLTASALWWNSEKQLLAHRYHALEALGRTEDAAVARAAVAKHDPNDAAYRDA